MENMLGGGLAAIATGPSIVLGACNWRPQLIPGLGPFNPSVTTAPLETTSTAGGIEDAGRDRDAHHCRWLVQGHTQKDLWAKLLQS